VVDVAHGNIPEEGGSTLAMFARGDLRDDSISGGESLCSMNASPLEINAQMGREEMNIYISMKLVRNKFKQRMNVIVRRSYLPCWYRTKRHLIIDIIHPRISDEEVKRKAEKIRQGVLFGSSEMKT